MYFNVFKRVVKKAFIEDIISNDITVKVKNISVEEKLIIYLTEDEIKKLNNTECKMNPEIKRAFLFACFTGLRFSDLNNLQHKSIKGDKIEKIQKKTKTPEYFPLPETAQELLKNHSSNILPHSEAFVFNLPSKAYYNTILKAWFKTAGIDKRASSHIARHTYACWAIKRGIDIFTLSKLMGHRNLKTTLRYAKVDDSTMIDAVTKFPNWEVAL